MFPLDNEINGVKNLIKEWKKEYKEELYSTCNNDWNHFSKLMHSEYVYLKYMKLYNDYLDNKYPINYSEHPVKGIEPREIDLNFVNRFLIERQVKDYFLAFDSLRNDFENQLEIQ